VLVPPSPAVAGCVSAVAESEGTRKVQLKVPVAEVV